MACTRRTYRLVARPGCPRPTVSGVNPGPSAAASDVVARTLRVELTAARVRRDGAAPRVVDVGGGSGTWAVPLAASGCDVTVVDTSANALAVLSSRARQAGVATGVHAVQGDVDTLADAVADADADLVLGHGLLEYVDDPTAACRAMAGAAAPGGAVSVLVAGRFGAVLSRVAAGRIAEARRLLIDPAGRWGADDPLQRRVDVDELRVLLEADGRLAVERMQGHRVLSDLVPDTVFEGGGPGLETLAELEDTAAGTPPLRDMASRLHVLARRVQ